MRSFLLVDDNVAFAENIAEILRDAGHVVASATSGADALRAARERKFDALVTDMRMPVMSGAKVVHEIRRGDPELPAIVVTAYTGEDDLASARNEGLLAVLPKPVPVERLIELLETARRGALVALVEDDAALADNLCEALRDRGFSAVTAAKPRARSASQTFSASQRSSSTTATSASRRAAARSSSRPWMGTGLESTASSPSRRAASSSRSATWAVTTMAGTPGSTRRISRTSSAPPITGMRMSVTTASKRRRFTSARAFSPPSTTAISSPRSRTISATFSAKARLSSTSRYCRPMGAHLGRETVKRAPPPSRRA